MYYGKDKGESTRPVQDAFDFKMECCCKKKKMWTKNIINIMNLNNLES